MDIGNQHVVDEGVLRQGRMRQCSSVNTNVKIPKNHATYVNGFVRYFKLLWKIRGDFYGILVMTGRMEVS